MLIKRIVWLPMVLLGLMLLATPAWAEEEEGGSPEEKIKKQMEKILELMKKNQDALLKLSTGAKGDARKVDVDIDLPPSKTGSSGGAGSDGSSGNSGSTGGSGSSGSSGKGGASGGEGSKTGGRTREEIRKLLDDLLKARDGTSKMIPGELAKLIKMIPEGPGKGEGKPRDNRGKEGEGSPKNDPQKARDGTKRLDEQEQPKPADGQKKPTGAKDKPRDPKDRTEGSQKPDASKREKPKDDGIEAWKAKLPPQIRDAVQNGDFTKIPSAYRDLVRRYLKYLAEQSAKK